MRSVCSILIETAAEIPDKPLFVFPETRWNHEEILTYRLLAERSAAAADVFAEHARDGERALLLFPTGAAFWEAFFGCLSSGIIPVPLRVPNFNRGRESLLQICNDCAPTLLLTDEKTAGMMRGGTSDHQHLKQLPVVTADQWRDPQRGFRDLASDSDGIALVQYTSGSTSDPKGVRVSHGNLLANMATIRDRMGIRMRDDSTVTWLPHYHDMGLVGSYLTTLFTKNTSICLPPEEFAVSPARWLQMISEHKASVCGGPDFAYRMCVDKISNDQAEGFELSSWRVAYVGAERIRSQTLRDFCDKFSRRGFHSAAFFPCYGLSEATLMATGGPANREPVVRRLSSAALLTNRIEPSTSQGDCTTLVGSGKTIDGSPVVIVDVETGIPLAEDMIGEVLVSGPSVTSGYFHQTNLNDQLFCHLDVNGRSTRFLRTGDLGFLSDGELFITGRIKEIIIVRGRNLSPDDVEQQISGAHEFLSPGGAVAFSAEQNGQEQLIVAVELKRTAVKTEFPEKIISAIRTRISEVFGVNAEKILLLRPASIPRTSSGKPKRLAVRQNYMNGTIEALFIG